MAADWLTGKAADSPAGRLLHLAGGADAVAVAGCYNGLSAVLAKKAGFKALYLSGAALSASMAMPDLGLLTSDEVVRATQSIARATDLPLIVDCDTGFGEVLNVMRVVRDLEDAGAACVQIEDQEFPKKCGHLNDKRLIPTVEMCRKIAAARKASEKVLICARTDAATLSLDDALNRSRQYIDAGADIVFVEALTSPEQIRVARAAIDVPMLGNMTEFGVTPQISLRQWDELGVNLVIYPVSALRIAARAMETFYQSLHEEGSAERHLESMMTRAELYDTIRYYDFEELDAGIARTVLPID